MKPAIIDLSRIAAGGGSNSFGQRRGWTAALFLVLAVAAWLRFMGIRYGLPALNDPDELMFELAAVKMLRAHTLNPGWFGHPATTTIYGLAMVDIGVFEVGHLAGWFTDTKQFGDAIYADPTWVILPGRVLMLVSGVLCVGLTYRLGRLLLGPATGLAAAVLLAFNPVDVAYSQIIRGDMVACVFMLLCLCSAVRVAREGRRADYIWAALWLGFAVASKWPFAVCGIAIAGAATLYATEHPSLRKATAGNVALFAFCALVTLVVVSPYLLLDHETAWRNVTGEIQLRHLDATGGTPFDNAIWYVRHALVVGLGLGGLALTLGGLVLTARHRQVLAIIFTTMAAFAVLIVSQHLVWQRWALPLMPLLSILAGAAAVWITQHLRRRFGSTISSVAMAVVAVAVIVPLAGDVAANARERANDTRQLASQWAVKSIPPGSTVVVEHFAFDLLPRPWRFLFPLGTAGCVDVRSFLSGKVAYADIEKQRSGRSNVDIGTIPPDKMATCQADYAILQHYDRYRSERDQFPDEFNNYQRLLANATVVATFRPERGVAGGNTIRIVRFDRYPNKGLPTPANGSPPATASRSAASRSQKEDR